jgi:hypothetical protein
LVQGDGGTSPAELMERKKLAAKKAVDILAESIKQETVKPVASFQILLNKCKDAFTPATFRRQKRKRRRR